MFGLRICFLNHCKIQTFIDRATKQTVALKTGIGRLFINYFWNPVKYSCCLLSKGKIMIRHIYMYLKYISVFL